MKRGDVVIAAQRGTFTGKPRPWLVVQRSGFLDEPLSITVCPISSTAFPATFRVAIGPTDTNGLREASQILADQVQTLRADAVQSVAGAIDAAPLHAVDKALRLWLDI